MIRTPASHGQWGGFNTELALAWVMDAGWPAGKSCWYARCGDRRCRSTDLEDAKSAAEAFARGAAGGGLGAVNLNAVAVPA